MAENETEEIEQEQPKQTNEAPEMNIKNKHKQTKPAKTKNLKGAAATAGLEQKLADTETELGEAKQTLLRTAAEYDNYRKRSQRENEAAFSNGVSHSALELLPVLDTLEAAASSPTADEEFKKGVELTLEKCKEIFEKLGIKEIEAENQPFNPEIHNAIMQEECEGIESGTIVRVMQKGYIMHERVIRHSMVAVTP